MPSIDSARWIGRWRRLHRRTGVCAALVVLILVLTGILLNHTDQLHLNRRFLQYEWLLNLYDIHLPENIGSYRAGDHWVSLLGDQLFLDDRPLAERADKLGGALLADQGVFVATDRALLLYTRTGELVERKPITRQRYGQMLAIAPAKVAGRVLLELDNAVYQVDTNTFESEPVQNGFTEWVQPETLPTEMRNAIARSYRGIGLPIERVLLDVHSGRILGRWGPYVVDAFALLFLGLAGTGVWMWWRSHRVARHWPERLKQLRHGGLGR